jgi:hypothetical protein
MVSQTSVDKVCKMSNSKVSPYNFGCDKNRFWNSVLDYRFCQITRRKEELDILTLR